MDLVMLVCGKGLLNVIVINDEEDSKMGWNICLKLVENGFLAKFMYGNKICFVLFLIMIEEQFSECCDIIEEIIFSFQV